MRAEALGDDLVAMMDISDGIAQDAGRLAAAGDAVAHLDPASIPASAGCDWRAAVGDGEDYELLFACRTPPPEHLLGTPVTVIGRLAAPSNGCPVGAVVVGEGSRTERIDHLGWEHRSDG